MHGVMVQCWDCKRQFFLDDEDARLKTVDGQMREFCETCYEIRKQADAGVRQSEESSV